MLQILWIVLFMLYAFPYVIAVETPTQNAHQPKYPPLKTNGLLYCPAENNQREELKVLSKLCSFMMTLFPKNFNHDEEKFCEYEVEAVLRYRTEGGKAIQWGENDKHPIYFFAFQYWKEELPISEVSNKVQLNDLLSFRTWIKMGFVPIYNIGYDSSINKVVWTRHVLETPSDDISDLQNLQNPATSTEQGLSTEPFCFGSEHFTKIDQAFKIYNENAENSIKMIKQQLVPRQDMPPMRKKSTNHIINTAALWDKLAALMEAINTGIRRAHNQLESKFLNSENATSKTVNRSTKHKLDVHTKLFYPVVSPSVEDLPIPYLWLKFVYHEPTNSGILIYVYNTPGLPPQQGNEPCDISEIACNFTQWLGQQDVTIENLNYAYCCKPSAILLEKYFPVERIKKNIGKILNIEKIIKGDIDLSEASESRASWTGKETSKRPRQEDSDMKDE